MDPGFTEVYSYTFFPPLGFNVIVNELHTVSESGFRFKTENYSGTMFEKKTGIEVLNKTQHSTATSSGCGKLLFINNTITGVVLSTLKWLRMYERLF